MNCQSARFGTIDYEEADLLTFAEGLLGFPQYRRYLIINHVPPKSESETSSAESTAPSPFRWMQSVEEPGLAFLVADPCEIVPDYSPALPEGAAEKLDLDEETPRLVYVIVTIPPGLPQEMTANLAGPIVINAEKRLAVQVVVDEPEWSPRYRILQAETEAA